MADFQRDHFGPWSRKLGDIMDEMLKRSYVGFRNTSACWQPATDVFETRVDYHICVELAGLDESEIEVHCRDERVVVISGVRGQPRPAGVTGPLSVHALEIDEGQFHRQIELPEPVVVDQIEATHSKGYLWIRLPKKTS